MAWLRSLPSSMPEMSLVTCPLYVTLRAYFSGQISVYLPDVFVQRLQGPYAYTLWYLLHPIDGVYQFP